MVDKKAVKLTEKEEAVIDSAFNAPKCKLIWEKDTPVVECETKEDVTNATRLINEQGVLIREVKVAVKVSKEETKE